jgi:hypothetical protein
MLNAIPITIESANSEIWARIVKAEARKYDCDVNIDFSKGNRKAEFIGDKTYMTHILEDVRQIFTKRAA